jgi:hypothetical protein
MSGSVPFVLHCSEDVALMTLVGSELRPNVCAEGRAVVE